MPSTVAFIRAPDVTVTATRIAFVLAGLAAIAGSAHAQEPEVGFDAEVPFATKQIIDIALDDPGSTVALGDMTIPAQGILEGKLVHLGGRLLLEGRVTGDVTAVGSEVTLRPGAVIDGRLTILGGTFYGTAMAGVTGPTTWLREEPIRVELLGPSRAHIHYEPPSVGFPFEPKGFSGIVIHEYNGVDGLLFGLAAGLKRMPGQPRTELVFGPVFRTARNDVGWDVAFLREFPRARGLALGGRVYRITDTAERWHRGDFMNSLASFFLADDDRLYHERTGYEVWAERSFVLPVVLRTRWRHDDFQSLDSERPFALLEGDAEWRDNPPISEGEGRALGGRITFDRRNAPQFATRGVYLDGRYDRWGFGGDFDFDWAQGEARLFVTTFDSSFVSLRGVAGGRLGSADTLAPQFWYRLGGGSSIPGYNALLDRLTGDRMAFSTLTYHQGIPVGTRLFKTIYLVGLLSVGDAWFEDEGPGWNASYGGGIAGRGQARYLGVFGVYGEAERTWQLYLRMSPWF
ncbi:MAG: BamA/TamA family outer membrane protein [Gemmatimonadota bacterium]